MYVLKKGLPTYSKETDALCLPHSVMLLKQVYPSRKPDMKETSEMKSIYADEGEK